MWWKEKSILIDEETEEQEDFVKATVGIYDEKNDSVLMGVKY